MTYRLKTRCPGCGKTGEAVHDTPSPVLSCGDCLMDRTEVVNLEVTIVEPLKLSISEPFQRGDGPILIHDQDHNDVAEFFHNERHTVPQSYETALALAKQLVQPTTASAPELKSWRTELDEVISHLGGAVMQSTDKDDRIIMDHVKAAHEIAKIVRRKA